jgi:thioredoxin-related protein
MKFIPLFALLVLGSLAQAKEGWLVDLQKAKVQAQAENKRILLDFTGSDWCPWCKKLDAEVFSKPEFKEYAAKHLVLVEVDFPHNVEQSEATKKQNDVLQRKYRIEAFPTVVILSPGGTHKGEVGYVPGGPAAFIKEVEKVK